MPPHSAKHTPICLCGGDGVKLGVTHLTTGKVEGFVDASSFSQTHTYVCVLGGGSLNIQGVKYDTMELSKGSWISPLSVKHTPCVCVCEGGGSNIKGVKYVTSGFVARCK